MSANVKAASRPPGSQLSGSSRLISKNNSGSLRGRSDDLAESLQPTPFTELRKQARTYTPAPPTVEKNSVKLCGGAFGIAVFQHAQQARAAGRPLVILDHH